MAGIETWLADASRNLSIPIRKLTAEDAARVHRQAQAQFVIGNPRVWWLDLKTPYAQYDSSTTSLTNVLPDTDGLVFLIPESDDELEVYEIEAGHLEAVLADCPYFEYNVVDCNLRWLVAESDHNVFFVCHDSGDRS
jgi:hypothetical protein